VNSSHCDARFVFEIGVITHAKYTPRNTKYQQRREVKPDAGNMPPSGIDSLILTAGNGM
jgi:hypothetical protein